MDARIARLPPHAPYIHRILFWLYSRVPALLDEAEEIPSGLWDGIPTFRLCKRAGVSKA